MPQPAPIDTPVQQAQPVGQQAPVQEKGEKKKKHKKKKGYNPKYPTWRDETNPVKKTLKGAKHFTGEVVTHGGAILVLGSLGIPYTG